MRKFKTSNFTIQIIIALFALTLSNCTVGVRTTGNGTVKAKPLPPGQAKKITGQKSAKNYAPGHN